ncbi:MAG TPA: DUF433 domain-containing protein [Chitinophagaceae bacterium]|nr:DUF433 domain-containing protein [Chitinophagaceae bacterium]
MQSHHSLIEISAEKRFGQPCIKGTRISVYDILSMLASGMSHREIIEDFPELNEESIKAALLFAADKEHSLRIAS